tara:strand:+ start:160 stop:396 length:237 start_codon:yes stop_codon:yes gene_type:complete
MEYYWIITHDIIEENLVGISHGDKTITDNKAEFELFDGGGELYAKGFIFGEYDGFEPLDDYGMPALGCTEIKINGEVM